MTVKKQISYLSSRLELTSLWLEFKSYTRVQLNIDYLNHICKAIYFNNIKELLRLIVNLRVIIATSFKLKHLFNMLFTPHYSDLIKLRSITVHLSKVCKYVLLINNINSIIKLLFTKFQKGYLPKKIKYIGVLKSPHVFKKAQDHYEYRIYKTKVKLPLIIGNINYLPSLIEQTSKFDSNCQLKFERNNLKFFIDLQKK